MTDVEIEYCVPCGYRDRAVDLARAILGALESEVDEVTLATGDHGVFAVRVDGRTVHEESADDYDADGVVRAVRERT